MSTQPLLAAVGAGLAVALLAWAMAAIGEEGLTIYRARFTAEARFRLGELFLFFDPARLFAANLALVALSGLVGWLVSGQPLIGLALGAGTALVPGLTYRRLRVRRMRQIEAQLADALLVIAGGLRAGVSLTHALQQLVREGSPPLAQEFDLVLREQRLGVSLDEALEHLAGRVPLSSLTMVIAAMRIAGETGGSLAEALERSAHTVRSQLAMEEKIRALTGQGKLQAIVVGLLPALLLLVLGRMEPEAMAVMWSTPMGWATLGVIAVLEACGVMLILRIVAIDV
ncbi:MAG: pilus assembly protein [Thauera phenolivorans]|uniref:Pilus assembly protein n=1 Tax=Thauera phenolivorans TaxID=1792543 RepID=A0A7X7R7K6_9RHOO|nr:pilus assembly protein [Thauera phenolivorans]